MNKDDVIKEAVGVIRRHLPREEFQVVLFGSWARGEAQETSDVDIGIMGAEPVDDMLFWRIREEVKAIPTLRRIDVADLAKTDDESRREILSYARTL